MSSIPKTRFSNRASRKERSKYHRLARRSKLLAITECDEDQSNANAESNADFGECLQRKRKSSHKFDKLMLCNEAVINVFSELARSGGDTTAPQTKTAIDKLIANYDPKEFDPRRLVRRPDSKIQTNTLQMEDTWFTLSKPTFSGCLGVNKNKECMYTLGRMSFGM